MQRALDRGLHAQAPPGHASYGESKSYKIGDGRIVHAERTALRPHFCVITVKRISSLHYTEGRC